jgi:hypothetical protein
MLSLRFSERAVHMVLVVAALLLACLANAACLYCYL